MKYISKEDPNVVVEAGVIKTLSPTRVPGHTGLDCSVQFDPQQDAVRTNIANGVAADVKAGDYVVMNGEVVARVTDAETFTDAYAVMPADEEQLGDEGDDSLDDLDSLDEHDTGEVDDRGEDA